MGTRRRRTLLTVLFVVLALVGFVVYDKRDEMLEWWELRDIARSHAGLSCEIALPVAVVDQGDVVSIDVKFLFDPAEGGDARFFDVRESGRELVFTFRSRTTHERIERRPVEVPIGPRPPVLRPWAELEKSFPREETIQVPLLSSDGVLLSPGTYRVFLTCSSRDDPALSSYRPMVPGPLWKGEIVSSAPKIVVRPKGAEAALVSVPTRISAISKLGQVVWGPSEGDFEEITINRRPGYVYSYFLQFELVDGEETKELTRIHGTGDPDWSEDIGGEAFFDQSPRAGKDERMIRMTIEFRESARFRRREKEETRTVVWSRVIEQPIQK